MQSIVGNVGIVEICMVTTFPVPRFFFGIVGRASSTVGKQGAVGRKPPFNFEDAPPAKVAKVAPAASRPDPTTLVQNKLLSWAVSQNGQIVGQDSEVKIHMPPRIICPLLF